MNLLIANASDLDGAPLALRIEAGVISALAHYLPKRSGEVYLDGGGGLLMPGLRDHHLHLYASAAAMASLRCGPPEVNTEEELASLLAQRSSKGGEWIRGVGFHDSVCSSVDRHWLDRVVGETPVRIQHRSGMLWVLSSAALAELGITNASHLPSGAERDAKGRLTGRFYNMDGWLGERFPRHVFSLAALSRHLASFGLTGLTDTGVNNDLSQWQSLRQAVISGDCRQRLLVMGRESLSSVADASPGWVEVGPRKLYLREVALPDLEQFSNDIRRAHEQGRGVAVHCVTRVELHFALAAIDAAGSYGRDRIEHASVADDEAIDKMARLNVTAVTQPHFIAERGDQYRRDVEVDDQPLLYRAKGFLDGGVALAGGSDAPYGGLDPWSAMAAAVSRKTVAGLTMGEAERLSPEQALALYGGSADAPGRGLQTLAVGQAADLCLLDSPWHAVRESLHRRHVRATLVGGQFIHQREDDLV